MSSFQEAPSRRRVLIVLPDDDYGQLLHHDEKEILQQAQVNVIRYDDFLSGDIDHGILARLDAQNLIGPGKVLVQDPFSHDIYYEQAEALRKIALRKHLLLSSVCQILGARSLSVRDINVSIDQSVKGAEFRVSAPGRDGEASVQEKLKKKISEEVRLEELWEGGEPDVFRARAYADRYGLSADANILNLIDMMEVSANKLKKRELVFNASSEANRNLSICGNLGLNKIASLKASYSVESSISQDVKLTIEICFP